VIERLSDNAGIASQLVKDKLRVISVSPQVMDANEGKLLAVVVNPYSYHRLDPQPFQSSDVSASRYKQGTPLQQNRLRRSRLAEPA
jgi:hypothetical protein